MAYFIKERGVSFIGSDGPNDVSPSGLPESIRIPLHQLALVAMGVDIFDNLDFERAAAEARRLNRYEFLFMAAPLRIEKASSVTNSPLPRSCHFYWTGMPTSGPAIQAAVT